MSPTEILKPIWQITAEPHFQTPQIVDSIFSKLVEIHTEKHRKYHNITHLQDLFGRRLLDKMFGSIVNLVKRYNKTKI
ncbi:MAG: hypothetical protein ACI81T_000868 [Bacteroidia bacterium]|jgi:hypothetical protein